MKTILLVEDDFIQRTILMTTLQGKGYQVYACDLAKQAVAFYKTHEIDYVITDIHLPDMDGFELLQILQLINPLIKVVGMSGQLTTASHNVKEMAMRNGFSLFLEKPVSATDLVNKFGELV